MIIDHIGIGVKDYEVSRNFYIKSLQPKGIEIIMEVNASTGHKWCEWGKIKKQSSGLEKLNMYNSI